MYILTLISYLCGPSRFNWNSDCADAGIFDLRCISRQSSNVTVQWDIPVVQQPGTYRIVVSGNAQTFNGTFLLPANPTDVVIKIVNSIVSFHQTKYRMIRTKSTAPFTDACVLKRGVV